MQYEVTGLWNDDTKLWELATVGAHATVANKSDAVLAIRNALKTSLKWTTDAYNTTQIKMVYLPVGTDS
jgi:hypothetical protein